MGAGSGGGYATSPSSGAAFRRNIDRLAKKYPLDQKGRFGKPARRADVQVVRSPDPAKTANEFFDTLSLGGRIQPLPRGNGVMGRFDDDSGVVYRPSSKSGGPAVNITIVGKYGDEYTIHFER